MIIEYDEDENEVDRFESFSAERVEELYERVGKDAANKFLDHLNMYGEARLRSDDPDDNGVLFKELKDDGDVK